MVYDGKNSFSGYYIFNPKSEAKVVENLEI